jgi:hypothetical protein
VAGGSNDISVFPMFYWFDWNSERVIGSGWGLVDNFHSGIDALAMASVVKSLMKRSWCWLLAGAGIGKIEHSDCSNLLVTTETSLKGAGNADKRRH